VLRLPVAIVLAFLTQLACAQTGGDQAGDRAVAGTVSLVEGDVRFLDPKQRLRRPALGEAIYEGESIVTGSDGEVHLDMQDGGYIGVRPGTRMRIVEFKAEGGSDDGFLIGLLEGSFRAVTGWITRSGSRRAEIQTPTATIGIRGTDYEPLVIPEGSKAGEPGTYNRVNIGETEMRTKEGSVIVKPNQAGFVPQRGAPRPRVLDRVPGFFKATRNEKRFEGLHQRIHQHLEERRAQRIKQIELRRRQGAKAAAQKSAAERRPEQRQREEALKQKRMQQAEKQARQREAQKAALQAQKQAEERRRKLQQQEHAKAAKKAEHEGRRKRRAEKPE
jgi:hypothetical protein